MNSKKYLILIAASSFICGCGVKEKPFSPPDTAIQSYINSYTAPQNTTPAKKK